eukprot:CAMPEP_0174700822 /NCGR_PEP_ID=MMETSP1094-20130205/5657_1 /TAXON_ID=156173 /ORGANISM="Chrysochromulina brevifilum, Strain UTEX LB 985" /LENGTH=327 /DNA_ID=CAMNT_0015898369 /DNA_START=188 /DNA_END=1172 /DNA_ORIENTATION=+
MPSRVVILFCSYALAGCMVHAFQTQKQQQHSSVKADSEQYERLTTTVAAELAAARHQSAPQEAKGWDSKESLSNSPLKTFFDQVEDGPGVWKWQHYFGLYDKHFHRFRGTSVRFAEVGIYSGGSLRMWRSYFGTAATIIGIDIAPEVKLYEKNPTYGSPNQIFVGDQANASFWEAFKAVVAPVDIFVDDGGHAPHQQKATLLAILPHMRPGGVYWCEDVTGTQHDFAYAIFQMLVFSESGLNHYRYRAYQKEGVVRSSQSRSTGIQKHVAGVSFYPYVVVVELTNTTMHSMVSTKRGTIWQPNSFWVPTEMPFEDTDAITAMADTGA